MPNFLKTPKSGVKPAVRQIKGPGMNKGLKKPHKMAQPEEYKPPRAKKGSAAQGSYLPEQMLKHGGKVQAMKSGKGKVISCKSY